MRCNKHAGEKKKRAEARFEDSAVGEPAHTGAGPVVAEESLEVIFEGYDCIGVCEPPACAGAARRAASMPEPMRFIHDSIGRLEITREAS